MSRRSAAKRISDLAVLAQLGEGRRFLKRELDESGMFAPQIVPGEPESSHFTMGQANAGQVLWGELLIAAPEMLVWYVKERSKEVKQSLEEVNDD